MIVDVPLERFLEGQSPSSWRPEPATVEQVRGAFGVLARAIDETLCQVESAAFAARRSGAGSGGFWMWADPIHIELHRDHGRARLGSDVNASAIDPKALFGVVRDAARRSGADLQPGTEPGRWLFRAPRPLEVVCASPDTLSGADLYSHRPAGRDRGWVDRFLGEVQMAIHEAFPQAAEGTLAPNAVWLSGGGVLPERPSVAPGAILATELAAAQSLWEWAGGDVVAGSAWRPKPGEYRILYAKPGLGGAQRDSFLRRWRDRELAAAVAGAIRGEIAGLRVSGSDGASARFLPAWWRWSSWRRRALLLARNLR